MKEGDGVKALPDSHLHILNALCSGGDAISRFGCTPELLNEVELAMIFGVEVTQMATPLNKFLELGSLVCEIRLTKKHAPAATIHVARGALEFVALSGQAVFWPQPPFANDLLHALKPARHGGMIVWEIECLSLPCR